MKKAHLILCGYWWDKIERGEKTVEYRNNTQYYRSRLLDATHVVLRRGYTSLTMTFQIAQIEIIDDQIAISLGARVE